MEQEPRFIRPSEVFLGEDGQMIQCPNCQNFTPVKYTKEQIDRGTFDHIMMPDRCKHCGELFIIQEPPTTSIQ